MAKYQFVAICPLEHLANQDGFERDELERRILANEVIALYCSQCRISWQAAPDLIESLKRSLAEAR